MKRIVVGYDGTERGADALALARALASPEAAEADVAVALVFPEGAVGAAGQRVLDARGRRLAERILDGARRAWPELSPGSFRIVQASSPAAGLHALADDEEADALVVGASRHSAPGRIFPGSVTEQTLRGAPCPVLVAPAGYARVEPAQLRRIGVAYVGSPEADEALAQAGRLACRCEDAHVEVIDADDPVPELLQASVALDLLLLGSRGLGLFRRMALGSVSTPVVRGAVCPLLVIPRASVVDRERHRAHPRWRAGGRVIA
jgi:nucleotide-binding universal stress UspA family protein